MPEDDKTMNGFLLLSEQRLCDAESVTNEVWANEYVSNRPTTVNKQAPDDYFNLGMWKFATTGLVLIADKFRTWLFTRSSDSVKYSS